MIKNGLVAVATAVTLAVGGLFVSAPTANAAPKSTATVKEYKKIKSGHGLSKVRSIIGSAGRQVTSGESRGSYAFVWRGTGGNDVYVRFAAGKVTEKLRIADMTVSRAEYKKIKKGQSYGKVKGVVREKGQIFWGYDRETAYYWCAADPRYYVVAYFDRNKLQAKEYVHWTDAPSYWPDKCHAII